jgi:hypothetical protein
MKTTRIKQDLSLPDFNRSVMSENASRDIFRPSHSSSVLNLCQRTQVYLVASPSSKFRLIVLMLDGKALMLALHIGVCRRVSMQWSEREGVSMRFLLCRVPRIWNTKPWRTNSEIKSSKTNLR